ncbi:hypothetical protein GCM10011533_33860 [Streptosporangium jomthongense]|uniref:DUF6351 family protein n=1 Tax=Marinobacter aromaticivorans TaxID=1494078 RepID=A0ABW2IYZ0_9GAMM|nr:DUF6351 family protein [Marinobacter aromaticivorans]GGE78772.1 hypothetical protein GCM10011533_33860 [Streptosporangium jomthongense]
MADYRARLTAVLMCTGFLLSACGGGSDNNSNDNLASPGSTVNDQDETVSPPAQMPASGAIEIMSNRKDLISGGNALVRIRTSEGKPGQLLINGSEVESIPFSTSTTEWVGLVEGLEIGENLLEVTFPNNKHLTTTVTNHPIGGPVFSGPQVSPWNCTNSAAVDEQCNQAPTFEFKYMPDSVFKQFVAEFDPESPGLPGAFMPYDPENPPADKDIASITTDNGTTVPFIVRVEHGVINRDRYQIMALFQPGQPWDALAPQPQWNRKLLIHHGGNVGVSFGMGHAPNGDIAGTAPEGTELLLGDSITTGLARGFVTLSTAQANLGHNANLVTAAESLLMSKEHVIEQYGPLRYTIGTGCSGGAIAQQHIANAYPGIYQGLIVQCSYPDVWTTAVQFADYNLINEYFSYKLPSKPEGILEFVESILTAPTLAAQWPAIYGHLPINPLVSDAAFFPAAFPDQESCPGLDADIPVYHPTERPDGLRCGLIDYMRNQFGERPPEVWSANEQLLGRGFTGIPLDNVGVQYGLGALQNGAITGQQFLALNRDIGGFNVDIDYQDGRTQGDVSAIQNAYRTGAINTAEHLDTVPIIDLRGPDPGIAHDAFHSWQVRERLEQAHGNANNQVIWFGALPLAGDSIFTTEALLVMDDWLGQIESDDSDAPLPEKIRVNKPGLARDRCLSVSALFSDDGPKIPLTGNLTYPKPILPGLDLAILNPLPAELGQIVDVVTGQVCGLDLAEAGLPEFLDNVLAPITGPVRELQARVVQTRFGTPRTVAGDDIATLNNKCALKPVDPADYPVTLTGGFLSSNDFAAEVRKIFPDGVCDYRQKPVGSTETITWLQYGDAEQVIFGGEPLPRNNIPVSGWASSSFETTLSN